MGLLVWLPLNGDLNNQGLGTVTHISGTPTYKTNGKIGSYCCDLNTQIRLRCNELNGLTKFTIMFWVKIEDNNNLTSNWNKVFMISEEKADNSATGLLRCETCYGSSYGATSHARGTHWHDNTNYAITDYSPNMYTSADRGIWHHVTFAVDTDNGAWAYTDGNQIGSSTTVYGGHLKTDFYLGDTNNISGCINDVRIYDNALSPKEIKEISKGLVLHYPLNRNGFGQDNIMPNSITTPVGSSNYSTGTWRLAGSSTMTKSRVAIEKSPLGESSYGLQAVGLQTVADAACWGIDSFPRESGATYTISCWGRIVGGSTTASMAGFSIYNATTVSYGGDYNPAKSSETTYYGSGATSYDYCGGQLYPNGSWTRVWRTFTSTAASGNIYIGFNTAQTGNAVTLQICGIKLEKGPVATPWTPNQLDTEYEKIGLDNDIIYDVSGYQNNGELYRYDSGGFIEYTSDSPRYILSTHVNSLNPSTSTNSGTVFLYGHCSITNPNQLTIAFWCKPIQGYGGNTGQGQFATTNYGVGGSTAIDYLTSAMNHRDSIIDINSADGNTHIRPSISFVANEWHHYAVVYNGQTAIVYKDGVEFSRKSFDVLTSLGSFIGVAIGFSKAGSVWRRNNSYYSDFRVYTTALNIDDISELYEKGR